jgi:transmembrane sensor
MTWSQDESTCDASLEGEALDWVNRALSGLLTPEDAEALLAWRARSPAHEQAFAEGIRLQRAVRQAVLQERRTTLQPPPAPRPALRPRRGASGARGPASRSGKSGRR